MPPRIPLFQCLRAPNVSSSLPSRAFTSSTPSRASTKTQKRRHQDPYAIAQAKARKAANLSRQEVLKKERAAALGDPVKGVETAFLRSLDSGIDADSNEAFDPAQRSPGSAQKKEYLNFFLNKDELVSSVQRSDYLSTPTTVEDSGDSSSDRPQTMSDIMTKDSTPESRAAERQEERDIATEALRRISSLSLANSKDMHRVNSQRIIEAFGRHETDKTLDPKPASAVPDTNTPTKTPRAGPDTGSSEVQIALLTAKIRTLVQFLETRGRMDKANKRNLRLLVHRRQKLMAYLRKKERGGPRWENLVEKLGLTEGMWRGQIVLDRNMKAIVPGTLKHEMYKDEKSRR